MSKLTEMAEAYASADTANNQHGPFVKSLCWSTAKDAYEAGARAALDLPEVRAMREALKLWLEFEDACIKRDGPYVSLKIPQQMDRARAALAAFDKLLEQAGS